MTTAALVPAAGKGERLGAGTPKALREVGGTQLLVHAVRGLAASRVIDLIVVAAPVDFVDDVRSLLGELDVTCDIEVLAGGESRQESVARALIALPADVDIVLVHDAARALTPPELIASVVASVSAGHQAVVPGLAVADTLKQVNSASDVMATPDRATLRAIQTPQGFERSVLQAAHAGVDPSEPIATDDAGLVERDGITVHVIPGHEEAFKVTRPIDLILAEAVLAKRRASGNVI